MSAIVADRLTKRFGDFAAVDGVSLEVPDGQVVAVLGPNGAGKTTTLEMLEGFLAPTSGTAQVLGVDPHRGDRKWRARIGLVLQSTSLDAEMSIQNTLTVFAGLYPAPRPVGEILELVDLADDAETRIGALSGGQRRRVDVAIGIIGRPDVLFLDEPTTGLDPEGRRRAWTAVESLATTGTTVVLTTHYIDEADHLASRLILLAGGQIADLAGYAAFGLTLTAWNTYGVRLVVAREAGVLKRWRAAPLPRWCYFLGRIVATVVVAVAAAAATVAAGVLLYHTHLTASGAPGAVGVFVLGAFAWAACATALASMIPTVEAASPTLLLTYFPVIIISGIFGSISEPHWLATIASYLPAQPLVHAVAAALGHTAGHALLPTRDLVVLAV